MLDPRIYRAAFVPVALALVVLAFSLYDQHGSLGTNLAPDAFNPQNAYSMTAGLAHDYPNRRAGSVGDDDLAGFVSNKLTGYGFHVSTDVFKAPTADGKRTLENVTATLTGFSSRPIVVVAHRDAQGSPAATDLSGTAMLLELARVLAGRTLNRTVILASTSGSVGGAGAVRLAHRLGGSVDAVLVLGDLAGAQLRNPVVVPYSDGQDVAPTDLRNTVAAALGAQANVRPGGLGLGGQFAHLAFPLATGGQGPFGEHGQPAVLLSTSGEHVPPAGAAVSPTQLAAFGRTALQTISALEDGPNISAPAPYLIYDKKVIPAWPIRLLVLALLLPVLAVAIDGYARARRRAQAVARWSGWVLAGAAPFVLATLFVLGLKLTGLLHTAPPEPVAAGSVPLHASGTAILVSLACLLALALAFVRPLLGRLAGARGEPMNGATAAAVPLALGVVTIAIWIGNPFAALLVVPALHLWIWVVAPDVRLARPARLALVAVGITPLVVVAIYYAVILGVGPIGLAWTMVLMVAGGHLSPVAALEWSIFLGCVVSVTVVALRPARADENANLPITVRGPVSYAGPGSLGGTESALRR